MLPIPLMMNATDFSAYTLLIAEDNESNFNYFKISLRKSGIKIVRASNGQEAVQLVESDPSIDIVFMDGMMPLMSGYDATPLIHQLRPELPVLLITAFVSPASMHDAVSRGCNDYLAKPISPDTILSALTKWLKSSNIN